MEMILDAISIGSALSRKNTISQIDLSAGDDEKGSPVAIRVLVASGKSEGPVLWLQGCLHGDEPEGMRLIHAVVESLDMSNLTGAIIAVPIGNPVAFKNRQRRSPVDDIDINRVFPGKADGNLTERLAHVIWHEIAKKSDLLIDIHAASLECAGIEHGIVIGGEDDVAQKSMALVRACGPRIMWTTGAGWLGEALFMQFALTGKPSMLFDRGYIRDASELDRHIQGFRNVMVTVGMLQSGDSLQMETSRVVQNPSWVPIPVSGVLHPLAVLGDEVKAKQRIARVTDLCGNEIGEVISPKKGMIVAETRHTYVHKDEQNQVALIG